MKNKKRIIWKLFLWSIIAFILLIVIGVFIIRLKYPPQKVKHLIETQLSTALNRPVEIEDVRINLLKGFVVEHLVIYDVDSLTQQSSEFVVVEKSYINYKLSSIFKRSIQINEIIVDRPQLFYNVNNVQKTKLDEKPEAVEKKLKQTTKTNTDSVLAAIKLPVTLKLDKFEFRHFNATIKSQTEAANVQAQIRDFSIFLNEFYVPRGPWQDIKNKIKTKVDIVSPNSDWKFFVESEILGQPREIESKVNLDIELLVNGINDVQLSGETSVGKVNIKELGEIPKTVQLPLKQLIHLLFNIQFDGDQEKLDIKQLVAHFVNENVISIKGKINNIIKDPFIQFNVAQSKIQLSNYIDIIKAIAPAEYLQQIENLHANGILSFNNTKISGKPLSTNLDSGLVFSTNIELDDFNASYSPPVTNMNGLSVNLTASGRLNNNLVDSTKISGKINLLSLNTKIDDSTQVSLKNFSTNLNASLSTTFFPEYVHIHSTIENIFDAFINIELQFQSTDQLNSYNSFASINLKNLELSKLPQSPASGSVISNVHVKSTSLENIVTKIEVETDSVYLASDVQPLVISPLKIEGNINLSTDTSFQNINVKNIAFKVNDFLKIRGSAIATELGQKAFNVTLDTVLIHHPEVFVFLPATLKQGLEQIAIDGATLISVLVNGKLPVNSEPEFFAVTKAQIESNIDYPEIPTTVTGINGKINLSSDGKTADATVDLVVDSLLLENIRKLPITNTSFKLRCKLPSFDKLIVNSGILNIPDLNSEIKIRGKIDSLSSNPIVFSKLTFSLDANDSLLIIDDLYILGNIESQLNLQMQQPLISVDGSIGIKNLNAKYTNQVDINGVNCHIPFYQKYDFDNLVLKNDKNIQPNLAELSALNFNLLHPYYVENRADASYFKINKVKFLDYEIDDVIMDLKLGNGKMEIPRFGINLLGGNIIGNIAIDFDTGELEKVKYLFKSNVSQLNSAKLILGRKGRKADKDSELNMNMELKGTGLVPEKGFDFNGYLYITKIGSRFAENVLTSLDPKGTDKSIQDTKRLLKWGYKPKLISFEIKHGYMYPTIHLSKGSILTKLIPLNLSGGKIELARMPIKFFMEAQLAATN